MSSTTTLHDHISQMTPIKHRRRKRPSFSPAPRAHSESPKKALKPVFQPDSDVATASLDFEEFSLWDHELHDQHLSAKHRAALSRHLSENFEVVELLITLPFLILRCNGAPPPPDKRPFSVAGCIAVWIGFDEPVPCFLPGNTSTNDELEYEIKLEDRLAADLMPYGMPKADTLFDIVTRYFHGAIAVSLICSTLVVEFPEIDLESWKNKIAELPHGFQNSSVALNYSNGPLTNTEFGRLKKPDPTYLASLQEDDSDYVQSQGCFCPGTMLSADSGNQISAGILVEKDGEIRLTVAFHCWADEYAATPDALGDPDHFSVKQGNTRVGYVAERVGETDIGLAKLDDGIVFSNRFLDIDSSAKTLLLLEDISQGDTVLIDSFVTGRQALRCVGIRIVTAKGSASFLKGEAKDLPGEGNYIHLSQGIWATNAPDICGATKIRAGVCGSAAVRNKAEGATKSLDRGEICGFMHWSDLQMKYAQNGELFCFADALDELVQPWLEVCPPSGEAPSDTMRDREDATKLDQVATGKDGGVLTKIILNSGIRLCIVKQESQEGCLRARAIGGLEN
ncbi:uncharacterized protein Z518_00825 [Rhinocladiella mackenziei CBS 650.93]|uniref:Uncharacterized protein n=1 Tax=Rhinocladiella mackenziei CBS 650.93 TaxID=1442369 RepID=A0A0D2IUJ0_9EURO|nr:uncharacterized protein Z518_00825 [Rhinocladiella mackenziei CBS 650.93]KIX09744.1 hypothetical protein Z518_00825 [Rhinocladiella mackenziei CBS 650.93]